MCMKFTFQQTTVLQLVLADSQIAFVLFLCTAVNLTFAFTKFINARVRQKSWI